MIYTQPNFQRNTVFCLLPYRLHAMTKHGVALEVWLSLVTINIDRYRRQKLIVLHPRCLYCCMVVTAVYLWGLCITEDLGCIQKM